MSALAFAKPLKRLPEEKRRIRAESAREHSKLEALADRLCGELVKRLAGGKCEASGYGDHRCSRTIDWAHGIARTKEGTRWAHANTMALCRTIHDYFTLHPAEFEGWRIQRFGGALLDRMAEQSRPVWRGDLKDVVEGLRRSAFVQGERS